MSCPRRQPKLVIDRGMPKRFMYGYRRNCYWHDIQAQARAASARRARWLRIGRMLQHQADCKTLSTVAHSIKLGQGFRRVDECGRSFGQRLTAVDRWRGPLGFCTLVAKTRDGSEVRLDGEERVRVCNMQTEEQHSRFSRMLKAAHRRGE